MDVKVITAYNDKEIFEKRIMEKINEGYKIHSSTIMPNTIGIKGSVLNEAVQQKVIFYALMIKE